MHYVYTLNQRFMEEFNKTYKEVVDLAKGLEDKIEAFDTNLINHNVTDKEKQAIIAAGAAYLNQDELSFSNLYKILIDEDKDIGISVKELIRDPAKAVAYIFKIKVNKVEINDITRLNRRMEELLACA